MKLQLNAGDWATLAFFALAVTLGCYAEAAHRPIRTMAPRAVAHGPTSER